MRYDNGFERDAGQWTVIMGDNQSSSWSSAWAAWHSHPPRLLIVVRPVTSNAQTEKEIQRSYFDFAQHRPGSLAFAASDRVYLYRLEIGLLARVCSPVSAICW